MSKLNAAYVADDLQDMYRGEPDVVLTRITRLASERGRASPLRHNGGAQSQPRSNYSAKLNNTNMNNNSLEMVSSGGLAPPRTGIMRSISTESNKSATDAASNHNAHAAPPPTTPTSILSPERRNTGTSIASGAHRSNSERRRVSIVDPPVVLRNKARDRVAEEEENMDENDASYYSSNKRASRLIRKYTSDALGVAANLNFANGDDPAMEQVRKLPPKLARQFTVVSFAGGYPNSLTKINNDLMFELRWLELYFSVYPKFYQFQKKPITLLNNVSGKIKSGQLVALMGPSGCGKSTLLDCIGGRRPWGISNGAITVNGGISKVRVALVPQKDEFYDRFSVSETVMYASRLKNPTFTMEQHTTTVARVTRHLGLEVCQNVKVHKCSGGQQKRISIAQELVSKPNILLLDEPTSGLDSSTCFQTLFLLTRLAHNPAEPMAIMISIHQPSARMFSLFDHVYFMAYRGTCVYEGPPKEIPARLAAVGLELPPQCNTADFMMEVASHDYGSEPVDKLKAIHASRYETDKISHLDRPLSSVLEKPNFPFWLHTWILIQRACVAINRDPILMGLRLFAHIVVPILLGILFSDRIGKSDGCPRQSVTNMQFEEVMNLALKPEIVVSEFQTMIENCGFLYLSLLLLSMMTIGITVLTFPLDSHIFIKEYKNGWYSIASYFIGRSMAEIAYQIVFVVIYLAGANYWTGQPWSVPRFLAMILIVVLANLFSQTTGLIIGAILINNLIASVFMTAVVTLPLALFTSFFVRERAMTGWVVKTISYSSYFHYGFKGLVAVIYGFGRCTCPGLLPPMNETFIDDGTEGSGDYDGDDAGDSGIVVSDPNAQPDWLKSFSGPLNYFLESRDIDILSQLPNDTGLSPAEQRNYLPRLLKKVEYSYLRWTSNCSEYQPIAMAEFEVTESSFTESIIALCIMVLIMRIITYFVLLARVKN